jgi:hypothetical protein
VEKYSNYYDYLLSKPFTGNDINILLGIMEPKLRALNSKKLRQVVNYQSGRIESRKRMRNKTATSNIFSPNHTFTMNISPHV